jgi:hypothetical protein
LCRRSFHRAAESERPINRRINRTGGGDDDPMLIQPFRPAEGGLLA